MFKTTCIHVNGQQFSQIVEHVTLIVFASPLTNGNPTMYFKIRPQWPPGIQSHCRRSQEYKEQVERDGQTCAPVRIRGEWL